MTPRYYAAANEFTQSTLAKLIYERFPINIRRRLLLLGADQIIVRRLAQVAEILPEDGVFYLDTRKVVQPRDGEVFEVLVWLQEPKHFDIAFVDFMRIDWPRRTNGDV